MTDEQPTNPNTSGVPPSETSMTLSGLTGSLGLSPVEPDHDPLLGNDLGGVKLVRLIAEGGMGRVYEGLQDKPRRPVAVKVMRPGFVSKEGCRRFDHESELLGRLRHPYIAHIHSAGVCTIVGARVPYFVMEFIPDALPITEFAARHKLTTEQRLALFGKVCEAVAHGHEKGVVHRDLKPTNILVEPSGLPKVIDFGVARSIDASPEQMTALTDMGQLIGTLQYMSPEQFSADPSQIDTRADVYALGVILYELLTGKPPYEIRRKHLFEAAEMVRSHKPVSLAKLNPDVQPNVAEIADICLRKDRAQRYADASELGRSLGLCMDGHSAGPTPVANSRSRGPLITSLRSRQVILGGVAALLCILSFMAWSARRSPKPPPPVTPTGEPGALTVISPRSGAKPVVPSTETEPEPPPRVNDNSVTVASALQKKLSLSFARDSLERTLQLLAKESGVSIEILVGDLQLEGITKNQSFGLDEREVTLEALLQTILRKANPDGKLVYVIRKTDAGESIVITTRAKAAERGELPTSKRNAGERVSSVSAAVDRLTAEVVKSATQQETLIVWLFDAGVSLNGQRRQVADRLQQMVGELQADEKWIPHPIRHVVCSFGMQLDTLVKEPTQDKELIVRTIENAPSDESGVENVFTAIERLASDYGSKSGRRTMVIVFTDEVGNDQDKVDQTCEICLRFSVPVYVVGVPAPFGIRSVKFKFVDPDPKFDKASTWAEIEQGPESYFPEVVQCRSGRYADEAIDSGFGPYSLSRLCSETGGIYFAVHTNGDPSDQFAATSPLLRGFFDPAVMRAYAPEYISIATLEQKVLANKAVSALRDAAKMAAVELMDSPTMTFPKTSDGDFINLLSKAQEVAAKMEPKINQVYATLAAGEKDRPSIREKRWQAGYDLSMGRVLATKVRTEAYNMMLALAKTGWKFKKADSDTWVLDPSDEITVGTQTEKLAARAKTYLERVINEHPRTPWALLAADELKLPLGYRWKEARTGVNDPKPAARNSNDVNTRPDDEKKMPEPPEPKRDPKKL